jgi:hypothetical protein
MPLQLSITVTSFCILVIAPITVLFDRIGLEEDEEEDVEFCAYTIVGVAFKTAKTISPAVATLTNPRIQNFEDDILYLSIITISIKPYL